MAQTRDHIIVGRVTTDSGAAIAAADVIVTIAPSTRSLATKSDSSGAYRVTIPAAIATGEYIVYATAVGRRPLRRRVTIAPTDSVAAVNLSLPSAVAAIAAVRIQAQRPRATRSLGGEPGPPVADGLNRQLDGVVNALPPELQGNFDAMASLIPGIAATSNGTSAFGLDPSANITTVNGIAFSAASIPRDLATTTTFLTSPWDPTRGGFSGVLTSTSIARGTNVRRQHLRATLDAPAMQVGDRLSREFGQQFTNVQLADAASGSFVYDKYFYNYALQVSHRDTRVSSLLDVDGPALTSVGIAADSATRLLQAMSALGIPGTRPGIPGHRSNTAAQFLSRFDGAGSANAGTAAPVWSLIVGADYANADASTLGPTVVPIRSGKTVNSGANVQALHSRFVGHDAQYLNETMTGVSFRRIGATPYSVLPSADVLLASDVADGPRALTALDIGGNSVFARDSRTWAWEVDNQTSFVSAAHPAFSGKLFLQSRYEHFDETPSANRDGTFLFQSIDDLVAGRASAYTRTLNPATVGGGQWLGAAALGGAWSTTHLTLSGGARADANHFGAQPPANAELSRTFGVGDRRQGAMAVSPRLGFNWYPTARKANSSVGSDVVTIARGSTQFRGGVGAFRSVAPTALYLNPLAYTGAAGGVTQLSCIGNSTPIPNWTAYGASPANVPTACAGGAFADTSSSVWLIDRGFAPSTAWRATLGWTNTIRGNYMAIDGVYALNVDQPSTVDVNFAGTPQFTLPDEVGRPVFVPASSIVAPSGIASPVASRRSADFGRVMERRSDLRSDSRQLTIYTIPNIPLRFGFVSVGYTYADARAQLRGFDGSTARDPRAIEWASQAFTPRHQFVVQAMKRFGDGSWALTASGRAMSGLRYTPVVAGDVNGDGVGSDRAFIFDPARASDSAVAAGLRQLLANGTNSARDCLRDQLNALAGRNSCVGVWTASMNAALVATRVPRTNGRMMASLNFANPFGAVDQLLHGGAKLHGWGASPAIDGTLYRIRGFDATAQRFLYAVNPAFGRANQSAALYRTPFRVTLDVGIAYGPSEQAQTLALALRDKPALLGTRAPADTVKRRLMASGFTDIYRAMLRLGDSLAFSRRQTEEMQVHQRVLTARADSIYGNLAHELVTLPTSYDLSVASKLTDDANDRAWRLIWDERPFLLGLLTPGQIRMLPFGLRDMMLSAAYRGRFYFGGG